MSPLRGLIRRLVGARPTDPDGDVRIILDDDDGDIANGTGDDPTPPRPGRRRGRRGGRNRQNTNGNRQDTAPITTTTATSARPPQGSAYTERRRRRDPAFLATLDQPLPEDVAFRPASEGGDSSILPVRRRRTPGPHTTGRVFVGEPTYINRPLAPLDQLSVAPDRDLPLLHVATPGSPLTEAPGDDSDPAPKRRRRGRRGGRGRRRDGDATTVLPGSADAVTNQAPTDLDERNTLERPEPEHPGPEHSEPEMLERERRNGRRPTVPMDGPFTAPPAFVQLGLGERSLRAVATLGFDQPTPIQERAIPVLLSGRDVVGVAQTGTGKTLAFGLPMLEQVDPAQRSVQALVLAPTRELAQQVVDVCDTLAAPFGIDVVGLLGGRRLDQDRSALARGPQVVVGTPGRILDHLRRGGLSFDDVRYAVLDEADQMLDIGFLPDITRILSRTPRGRQTALFSATMPTQVRRLIDRYMREPERIEIDAVLTAVDAIEQVYFEVASRDKLPGLRELVDRELRGRTLVFCRTKRSVDRLMEQLQGLGVRVGALHGDLDQRRRDRMVRDLREGHLDILVATDVAARGLDIPEITHVVNYDVPQTVEEYVHRIGRTGRAGRSGKAITFVSEHDYQEFDAVRAAFGDQLHAERLHLYA